MTIPLTPREAYLAAEVDKLEAEVARLKYELGPMRELKELGPGQLQAFDLPDSNTVSLTKRCSIRAQRNSYGSLHVAAVSSNSVSKELFVDYYLAGVDYKDSDIIEILGRSHRDFIMRLAQLLDRSMI